MKKIVVISGGSDGLGKTIAKQLAVSSTVIILSPTEEKLKQAALEIGCIYEVCDVAEYQQVKKTLQNIIKKHTKIDCLINNAGLWIEGELDENNPQHIQKVIEVNTKGVIYLSKGVIPYMKKQKSGLIINIVSQAGISAKKERTVYNASKWAVTGFTKSLQLELRNYGIRVSGIYPGKLKTNMFEKMGIQKEMKDALEPSEVARAIDFIISLKPTTLISELGIQYFG